MMLRLATVAVLANLAAAHMALQYPCPRFSNKCDKKYALPAGVSDYDSSITTPIGPGGALPLCKSKTPWPSPVASWTAGESVTVKFYGTAIHGGGHCQFSMSYDGGNTFAVVYEVLGDCFLGAAGSSGAGGLEYTFKLPDTLPASKSAVFAWSWVNAIGNREFYMNCADVTIAGTSPAYTGKAMTIANYPNYPSIPEFSGNKNTGIDLYKNAKSITVSANGGSTPANGPQPLASANADKQVPPTSSVPPSVPVFSVGSIGAVAPYPDVYAAVTVAPQPTPPGDDGCSEGGDITDHASKDTSSGSDSSGSGPSTTGYAAGPVNPEGGGGGSCSTSQIIRCATGGTGFQMCVFGSWSPERPCGPGTVCIEAGDSAYCGWPKQQ